MPMEGTASDNLKALLARYPAICRPCRPPEALGNAGGWSGAQLWRYDSGRGPLVARAWPPEGPNRAILERIHAWLGAAAHLGFVPVPLQALDGRTVQEQGGRLWEVAAWLEGAPASGFPPPLAQLRSGFTALAAFHQALGVVWTLGPSPGIGVRLRELEGLIGGGFDVLERAVRRANAEPRSSAAGSWLALARASAGQLLEPLRRASATEIKRQPCLRDARPEHLLFSGDRVTGLIDFGAMDVENVAADLARLLGDWVGPQPTLRSEALAAYTAVRPLEAAELALIELFEDSAALLGPGHWVRWHFLEGRAFDDPSAVAAGIDRGLQRLALRVAAWTKAGPAAPASS
jgi:homoserine kinase type II